MTGSATDRSGHLDPDVLAKISGLQLRARLAVEGLFAGMHRSPYRGVSVEFTDHRAYAQGDDIRHIDWKLFGRTNKYYVKEFEQDTNLNCVLVVDGSESMAYRNDAAGLTKYEYAAAVAASVAYLALQQQDSVGLVLFDHAIRTFLRPSNNPARWRTLVDELDGSVGPAKTSMQPVFDAVADRFSRALVVVASDLFDDPAASLQGLRHLRYRGNDVIVFHVWDRAEREFPFRGPTRFEGLEGGGTVQAEPRELRAAYLAEVERFTSTLRSGCSTLQIDYVPVDTQTSLGDALSAYLVTRGIRARSRTWRTRAGG
jgi:uncharacterized protein (DUF58 family)